MGRGYHLTIDEWFFHWFEDESKSAETTRLFITIFETCDKIFIHRNSNQGKKFYLLSESSSMFPPIERRRVKLLFNLFLSNLNKVEYVDETESLDEFIAAQLPTERCLLSGAVFAHTRKNICHYR